MLRFIAVVFLTINSAALLVLRFLDGTALGAGDLAVGFGNGLHACHFRLARLHAGGFAL